MFGRGATDVLIESSLEGKENFLISFKEDEATKLVFYFDKETGNRRFTREPLNVEESKEIREYYNLRQNGTIVKSIYSGNEISMGMFKLKNTGKLR
jgi:hypothetical protein